MNTFDNECVVRYIGLVDIIKSWVEDRIRFENADILDFGCGEGVTALGFANRLHAKTVCAVDIMPDVHQCLPRAQSNLGCKALPSNLMTKQIAPGENFFPDTKFDLIYSWSAFEHVEQPLIDAVIQQLVSKLKPGGLLFTQIAPLYHSAEGGHLFHKIPIPWGHLSTQDSVYFPKLASACESKQEVDALWSCYQTLNKLTVPELKRRFSRIGLKLVKDYMTQNGRGEPPIELKEVFDREVPVTDQIVLLHQI